MSRTSSNPSNLLTLGELARRFDRPVHRIRYALSTRDIPPVSVAGIARVWDQSQLHRIEDALAEIERNRSRPGSGRA